MIDKCPICGKRRDEDDVIQLMADVEEQISNGDIATCSSCDMHVSADEFAEGQANYRYAASKNSPKSE